MNGLHEYVPSPGADARRAAEPAAPTARKADVEAGAAGELVGSPYPRAVGRLIRRYARVQVGAWAAALARVRHVQEETLASLLRHARGTEFGRAHELSAVRDYDDFVRRVPVGDYDSFSSAIDRMKAGARNVLVPERVRHFGNSSGSSNHGKPKFLPITERQVRFQRRAGADVLMRYLDWSRDDALFDGFTLGLFPPTTMRRDGPSLVTSNPALMVTKMPLVSRPVYLPEADVRAIADYDRKLTVIAERYLHHDVRAVAGTTCWFSLLFERVLGAAR